MAHDPNKLRPIPGMGPGFYEAGPLLPGEESMSTHGADAQAMAATLRVVTIRGVKYPETEVVHAIENHVSLRSALEQLHTACLLVPGGNGLMSAMLAAGVALNKARRRYR